MFSALFHLLTGQWIPRNVWNFLLRKLRPGAYEVHGSAATVSVAPWPPKLRASKLQCPMFGVSEFFHKLNLNLSNEFCRISKWQIYGIPILRVFFWTEYSPIFRICVDHLEHHEHTLQKGGGGAAGGMTLHTFVLWSTTKIWWGNLDHWISFRSGVTLLWLEHGCLFRKITMIV